MKRIMQHQTALYKKIHFESLEALIKKVQKAPVL